MLEDTVIPPRQQRNVLGPKKLHLSYQAFEKAHLSHEKFTLEPCSCKLAFMLIGVGYMNSI